MADGRRKELESRTQQVLDAFTDVPQHGLGLFLRLQVCVMAMVALEDRCSNMDEDPYPALFEALSQAKVLPDGFAATCPHVLTVETAPKIDGHDALTREMFQTAWTAYSADTYRHSIGLMQKR
jgi:hypothetical protein